MLMIEVLGRGLIPRGYGLAPRLQPFPADYMLIATILSTPGLKVNMIHPEDGHRVKITSANLKHNWDLYHNKKHIAQKVQKPVEKKIEVKEEIKVIEEVKSEPVVQEVVESAIPVITSEDLAKAVEEVVIQEEVKVEEQKEEKYNKHNKHNKYNNYNSFKPVNNPEETK